MKNASNDKVFGIENDYFANLLIIYIIAHGGLFLILNAIYWDDWTLYHVSAATILETFQLTGSMFNLSGHLHVAMLAVGPWLYKVLTFILMFWAGMLFWKILERQKWIGIHSRYFITLLFLVLPFYSARVALIDFGYTLCYFLFFVGWYFLGKNRLLSLGFFFFSFYTNSMLVFYTLPMAEWFFRDGNRLRARTVGQWLIRKIDLMILPFVFWFIKISYFKPHGRYSGYNEHFNFNNLGVALTLLIYDFIRLKINFFLLVSFFVFVIFYIKKPAFNETNYPRNLLITGVIALVCAVFPYWILGYAPTFYEWSSRHQLLLPLGTALLLVALLTRFTNSARHMAFTLLIAVSLAINVQNYTEFYKDWSKQRELVSLMAHNDQIREARLIIFDDRTENALKRSYRFYEWNGLMKLAFGDETRFGLGLREVDFYLQGKYDAYFLPAYNDSNHVRASYQKSVVVTIKRVDKSPNIYVLIMGIIRGEPNYNFSITSS